MKIIFVLFIVVVLSSCSSSSGSRGGDAQIYCYSGGKQFYNNPGEVLQQDGNFVQFIEEESGKLMEIHADCWVKYK